MIIETTPKDKEHYLNLWKNQYCGVVNDLVCGVCTVKATGEPLGSGTRCTGCPYYF